MTPDKIALIVILVFIITLILVFGISLLIFLNTDKGKSFNRLYHLDPKKVKSYFDSYNDMYSHDIKMFSDINDYKNNIPSTGFVIPKDKKSSEYSSFQYNVLKDLCNLGNVKKMYIPPTLDLKKSFIENQRLTEQYLAAKLNVKPSSKILDIGCGCGRIAHHISQLTKSQVYGINIDEGQLSDARQFAKRKKTSNQFLFNDLNDKYPFPDNHFDAIYSIQACVTFIRDNDSVFKEINRVLKPGGVLFINDCVLMDNFDGKNPHHVKLLNNSRMVMAAGFENYYKYYEDAATRNGFKILESSSGGTYPNLARDLQTLKNEHANYQKIENKIKFLSKCKFLPKHMPYLIDRLRFGADDLVEMLEKNMMTMTWDFYFQKK